MDFHFFHAAFICSPLLHPDAKIFRKQVQQDEKKPTKFRTVMGNTEDLTSISKWP